MTAAAYTVLFYTFAAMAVLLALGVTNAPRLLRAAVYLMGVLMVSAGMYVLLGAEFLAGIQVLVYVGGIVVLIVFAVMLTRSAELQVDSPSPRRKLLAGLASVAFLAFTGVVFWTTPFPAMGQGSQPNNDVLAIGKALLDQGPDGYVLPFEIVSLLLLAALIGGVVVARKTPPRDQPFTSGGDLLGEADFQLPHSQRESRGQTRSTGVSPVSSVSSSVVSSSLAEEQLQQQQLQQRHGQDAHATYEGKGD
jgi:NADH-quinone oxidoreductase subunit J